jgi:Mrp family chromosome partitioning ATPase
MSKITTDSQEMEKESPLHQLKLQQIGSDTKDSVPIFHPSNPPHPQIKNIIAVGSGKGGVGKSTLTYLIAQALVKQDLRVGILDADIYGPSQPLLHQATQKPDIEEGMISPLMIQNIQLMSIGLINRKDSALSWRGPMIAKALMQMFLQTKWEQLDYLLVDLPPGTGDIPMSLCQKLPTTAYISVTTSHPLSINTNEKFIMLMEKMEIPSLANLYNQSNLEEPHHIPHQKQYQTLSPVVDQHILDITSQILNRLYQLPIYQPENKE